jgi:hypothetical protein
LVARNQVVHARAGTFHKLLQTSVIEVGMAPAVVLGLFCRRYATTLYEMLFMDRSG